MNNSLYDDYMRSVLGYRPMGTEEYYSNMQNDAIENMYPDTYRLIYPMVQKRCAQSREPITKELVDNMTNEIYLALEDPSMYEDNRGENRQRNPLMNDLIRILILRELLPGRPPRPSFPGPGPGPRPPFPGPGPRPPRPRGFEDLNNGLYENI